MTTDPYMDEDYLIRLLMGSDLRTLRNNEVVVTAVNDQKTFDKLFTLVFRHERPLVMRAVDAVEKVTISHPEFLKPHKAQLLNVLKSADHKELKWHVAQLLPRLSLTQKESENVWHMLSYWALNPNESKIVRVNALQGLCDLAVKNPIWNEKFNFILDKLDHDFTPSLSARIRKIRKHKG